MVIESSGVNGTEAFVNNHTNQIFISALPYLTCVILVNSVVEGVIRRCGVLGAPLGFRLRWRRKRSVDVFDNQYAKASLLSCPYNFHQSRDMSKKYIEKYYIQSFTQKCQ
jgi:hypothetical protein